MESMKIAAIHVDPQKGFTEFCPLELPIEGALNIIDPLNKMFKNADFNILSRDWHQEGSLYEATDEFPMGTKVYGHLNVDLKWNKHCVAGTYGSDILTGIAEVELYDLEIKKGMEIDCHPYSALWHDLAKSRSTGIIEFLRSKDINHVMVGGLALDFCVRETVLDLLDEGFTVYLIMDATCAVFPDKSHIVIEELSSKGAVITTCAEQAKFRANWE